jgi:hypothetical protein
MGFLCFAFCVSVLEANPRRALTGPSGVMQIEIVMYYIHYTAPDGKVKGLF